MKSNRDIFENATIPRALIALSLPTIVNHLIHMVYNMADTFFVGWLGDPNQVAATSLSMPLFAFMASMANLFGVGGASLISRSLGAKQFRKVKNTSAFCVWSVITLSVIYGGVIWLFRGRLLPAIGCNEGTFYFCYRYCFWTVCLGATPAVLSSTLAHLLRAEGYSKQAALGQSGGGILNAIMDPVFIFVFDLGIEGAAIATMISNVLVAVYFILLIRKKRDVLTITLNPKYISIEDNIPSEVVLVGLPTSIMNVMMSVSNITVNKLVSAYSNEALAGYAIAKKIDSVSFAISMGLTQGIMPFYAYNYAAGNFKRMLKAIKTTFIVGLTMTTVLSVSLFCFASPLVRMFIDNPETVHYGQYCQRVIAITGPCISVVLIVMTFFQAIGKKVQPLVLSLVRRGGLDIPLVLIMNALFGLRGIAWAPPMSDALGMIIAGGLFLPFWRKIRREFHETT